MNVKKTTVPFQENQQTFRSITIANGLFFEQLIHHVEQGRSVTFLLRGTSMMPFLREGDRVAVKPVSDIRLRPGHIVLFRYNQHYLLHRIVHVNASGIVLAGDANLRQVEKIRPDQVLAFVHAVCRNNQSLRLYTGWALLCAKLWYHARPLRRVLNKLNKQ